jgi:hypothetical protein
MESYGYRFDTPDRSVVVELSEPSDWYRLLSLVRGEESHNVRTAGRTGRQSQAWAADCVSWMDFLVA